MNRSFARFSPLFAAAAMLGLAAACAPASVVSHSPDGTSPDYVYGGGRGGSGGSTVDPSIAGKNKNVAIGFELSARGDAAVSHDTTDVTFWVKSAQSLSAKVPGSVPAARLVVGTYGSQTGSVQLAFPRPASTTLRENSAVSFGQSDAFEDLLTGLDGINAQAILEVQPGYADASDLADAILAAYGRHASVAGVSFDLRYDKPSAIDGSAAKSLVAFITGKNANYSVELRSNDPSKLPDNGIAGLTYVLETASQSSLTRIISSEVSFASQFKNSPMKFIVGVGDQQQAVCAESSPEVSLLSPTLSASNTVRGVYWSDSTVAGLNPGKGFACTNQSNNIATGNGSSSSSNASSNSSSSGGTSASNGGSSSSGLTAGSRPASQATPSSQPATSGGNASPAASQPAAGTGSAGASSPSAGSGASTGAAAGSNANAPSAPSSPSAGAAGGSGATTGTGTGGTSGSATAPGSSSAAPGAGASAPASGSSSASGSQPPAG